MSPAFDVAVCGGGPAGAAAAIGCARAGLSVVLIEADDASRPAPCESLHPGMEPLLARLGVGDWMQSCRGRYGAIDAAGARIPYGGDWRGYHVDRKPFDDALRRRVGDAGAALLSGRRAVDVLKEGARVTGLRLSDGVEISARWTIDATGHRRLLARKLRLDDRVLSPPLTAWRGETSSPGAVEPRFRPAKDGWEWSAGLACGRTVWTTLRIGDRSTPPAATGAATIPAAGRDVTWRIARPMAGSGFLLTGEAAATFDPACGQGVFFALTSGLAAAQAILAAARSPGREGLCLARFDDWMVQRSEEICDSLRGLYQAHGIELNPALV